MSDERPPKNPYSLALGRYGVEELVDLAKRIERELTARALTASVTRAA